MTNPVNRSRFLGAGRRGRRAIPINAADLLAFLKRLDGSQAWKCVGLPPDADLVAVEVDQRSGQIVLVVSSAAWEGSVLESRVPWQQLKFTT